MKPFSQRFPSMATKVTKRFEAELELQAFLIRLGRHDEHTSGLLIDHLASANTEAMQCIVSMVKWAYQDGRSRITETDRNAMPSELDSVPLDIAN